ncbi:MAG: PQQ-dependent sugar dehydrogenase [Candidatus Harrisonbacteria bacterium]|nr:PQQ-dependent sugar dehydrogenase [Candidatus Harrisonbacteria bacterium]
MAKIIKLAIGLILLATGAAVLYFVKPSEELSSPLPLNLPAGFKISIFAKDLPGARAMVFDQLGNMWVSRPSEGAVTLLEIENGQVVHQDDIFRGLNRPHGLAIYHRDPFELYIAETDKISKVRIYSEGGLQKIADLPAGGQHSTRTIDFGPDERLYVSIGSSCNVCNESDDRRAKIFSMNPDGSGFQEFARGLRNAVFFDWSYVTGEMWATEMGRDFLGDDLPPDEINIVKSGKNYGWPICYGKNVHDTSFDKNTYIRNPCMEPFETQSHIDIPAHSAPLGLAFIPEEGWPESFWYNLLVAYHGSWNRSEATGYKIVRYKLAPGGAYIGEEDFITGWLTKNGKVLGRPVDIIAQPGGTAYISDDKAGVIYKVVYEDLYRLDNLKANDIISSPFTLKGTMRGFWFFEASFPVRLLDGNDKEIAVGIAMTSANWMTVDLVPFETKLEFSAPATANGTLVLQKDNPSGLPENDQEVRIPIRFK